MIKITLYTVIIYSHAEDRVCPLSTVDRETSSFSVGRFKTGQIFHFIYLEHAKTQFLCKLKTAWAKLFACMKGQKYHRAKITV